MPSTSARIAAVLGAILGAATAAGCGSRPPAVAPPTPVTPPVAVSHAPARSVACDLLASPASPRDTITIAVTDTIDPAHAPTPHNPVEQLLFDQLYHPLVGIDCAGVPRVSAAERWSVDAEGRVWTFTLSADERAWGGAPVTAADVVAGWGDIRALGLDTAVALDDRRLAVTLEAPTSTLPPVFGTLALAVRGTAMGTGWPEGSGPYRLAATTPDVTTIAPVPGASGPILAFRRWPGRDLRDALDGRADVLVTDDPAAIAYAGTRSDFDIIPLAWDRTYVLVSTAPSSLDDKQRLALARDAVDVDAQAATGPLDTSSCPDPNAQGNSAPAARVAYPRDDRIAGRVAERLVALKIGGNRAVAVGLAPAEFAASLGSGRDAAYVLPLSKELRVPCPNARRWPGNAHLEPLIDTRRHLIVRHGTTGLSIDVNGLPRLEPR